MEDLIQEREPEVWKKISSLPIKNNQDYANYSISSWGNVRIDSENKLKKLQHDKDGFNRRCVSKYCNGKIKSSGGYNWMYEEDYNKMVKNNENN